MNGIQGRLSILALLAVCLAPLQSRAYQDITADSLANWLKSTSPPYLLDVREQEEFIVRYIPGAVLIPYNSGLLQKRFGKLPTSGPIVVVCKDGSRSASAAQYLENLIGLSFKGRLSRLAGGMDGWQGTVVLNGSSGVKRELVLFEMFTASWCSFCFDANKYLYGTFIGEGFPLALVHYHVSDPAVEFESPTVRVNYLEGKNLPDLFVDGSKEVYPLNLSSTMVSDALDTRSTLSLVLLGEKPTASDSGLLKVELTGSALVSLDSLNLFAILTESKINPATWTPPFTPSNGEEEFNDEMRVMITGQSGLRFAIQPGEKLQIQKKFGLNSKWNANNCKLVVFVQNMKTRKVQQTASVRLPDLRSVPIPANRPPSITLPDGQSYHIYENDTLRLTASITDPDSAASVIGWAFYSANGVSYGSRLPDHASFSLPEFTFAPDTSQAGLYRFMLRVMDSAGASDSVRFTVEVQDLVIEPERRCDCDRDGRITVRDVLTFLLLLHSEPAEQSLDWNGDGQRDLSDVLAFARDVSAGSCPDALLSALAAASTSNPRAVSAEERAWIESVLPGLGLEADLERDLRAELAAASSLPKRFSLAQNSPNPFNPSTVISYEVPALEDGAVVSLKVYDLRGRVVRVLATGEVTPGRHSLFWDGRDGKGRELPSGVYLYRLTAGDWTQTRKMVLLR